MTPGEAFWEAIRTRFQPEDEKQLRRVAYSVIGHLKERIEPPEDERLVAEIYNTIGIAPSTVEEAVRIGAVRPFAGYASADKFVDEVQHDAGLKDHQAAEQATRAVLHGLQAALPQEENDRIAGELPAEIRELWQ